MSNFNLPTAAAPSNEPGLLGFLSALTGGLHANNQQREQETESKQKFQGDQAIQKQQQEMNSQQIASNQADMAARQVSMQKQRGEQALQSVLSDPTGKRGQDPIFQKAIIDSLTAQGLPVPKTGKGDIDYNALKPSVGDMFKDPKAVTAFMQQSTDVRKAIASNYSNFPKELTTAATQSDLRGEASLIRATAYAKNLPKVTEIADRREHAQAALYGDIGNMDAAHAILFAADARKATAEAGVVKEKADALVTRTSAYAQSVQNASKRLSSGDRGAAAIIMRSADGELRSYNSQIDSLQGQWAKLAADPTIPADDPRITAITSAIGSAQKTRDDVQTEIDTMRSTIQSGQPTAQFLTSGSGQKVTPIATNRQAKPIEAAPAGVSDGYYPNARGGAVTVKNGQVYKGQI